MTKFKTDVIVKEDGKFTFLYFTNVPVWFAKVHEPKLKHKSKTDYEYALTAFIDEATKEKAFELRLNKKMLEVGKDRKEKGDRGIKYPLEDQLKDDQKYGYDAVKGMFGVSVGADEVTKQGKKRTITVIDKDCKPTQDLIGNGSICTIKCLAYTTTDGDMNIILNTVQVVELVEFSGGEGDGTVQDDVFGGSYKPQYAAKDDVEEEESKPAKKASKKPEPEVEEDVSFDDDIPF